MGKIQKLMLIRYFIIKGFLNCNFKGMLNYKYLFCKCNNYNFSLHFLSNFLFIFKIIAKRIIFRIVSQIILARSELYTLHLFMYITFNTNLESKKY